MAKSRKKIISNVDQRLSRLRKFVGSVIERRDTKARFRITDVHLRASDGAPHFTYVAIGADEALPFSRPSTEVLDGRLYSFRSGAYRPVPHAAARDTFIPRHVLHI